jgi:hypothetical protein
LNNFFINKEVMEEFMSNRGLKDIVESVNNSLDKQKNETLLEFLGRARYEGGESRTKFSRRSGEDTAKKVDKKGIPGSKGEKAEGRKEKMQAIMKGVPEAQYSKYLALKSKGMSDKEAIGQLLGKEKTEESYSLAEACFIAGIILREAMEQLDEAVLARNKDKVAQTKADVAKTKASKAEEELAKKNDELKKKDPLENEGLLGKVLKKKPKDEWKARYDHAISKGKSAADAKAHADSYND